MSWQDVAAALGRLPVEEMSGVVAPVEFPVEAAASPLDGVWSALRRAAESDTVVNYPR